VQVHEKHDNTLQARTSTLQATLLFWQLLSDTLQEWGFKLNDYKKCASNRIVEGQKCTNVWHVDNLKISHTQNA